MHSASTQKSIAILRAVLAGETYDAVAAEHGLTRTAIEHRVKRLAKELQRQIGIADLNPEASGYVFKLRMYREDVEAALDQFEAGEFQTDEAPKFLSERDLHTMIHRAGLRSPTPIRDMALIYVVLATGARPLEVARLEIADYLNPDGSVRTSSEMRASVSVNRKPRPLFFRSEGAVRMIDAYLDTRKSPSGAAPGGRETYRGFEPNDRLFLNEDGLPYVVHRQGGGGRGQFLCRQMLDSYRRIFKRVNMPGVSALTLRRTVAILLDARGADEEQIGTILGIAERQAVRNLLPRRPGMEELMTNLPPNVDLCLATGRVIPPSQPTAS